MKALRRLVRRWHRWVGVLVAAPVLLLAVTGILLNHLDALSFRHQPMPLWLAAWYGAEPADQLLGAPLEAGWVVGAGDQLFVDGQRRGPCPGRFRGAIQLPDRLVAACGDSLVVLSSRGELMETLGPAWGVPVFSELGRWQDQPVLVVNREARRFSLESIALGKALDQAWEPAAREPVPRHLAAPLLAWTLPDGLDWQRLLQDLHSGRLFGLGGRLFMDLVALGLILLALSGVWVWWQGRGRRR